MGWLLLIAGVALWAGAHLFKRVAPDRRAEMGDRGRGLVAGLLVLSILLMILGYRWAPYVPVWSPPSFLTHVNNLGMLAAFYLMSPAPKKGRFLTGLRHPMLLGFGVWAGVHLLVNGHLAAIILFGGLLAWSVFAAMAINRAVPDWTAPPAGEIKWDAIGLAGSVVLLVVVGYIHFWLGVWPFG